MFKKVCYFTLFILSAILTLTLFYNSCSSQSAKNIKFSKILSSFLQDFKVEIKNGSYSTKTLKDIPVNFKVPTKNLKGEVIDYEMKISQTPDCSDGEWEPYQKETTWTFQSDGEEEKLLFIYVKFREKRTKRVNYTFRDKDFEEIQGESKCTYDSIVYDTKAPEDLQLIYKPAKKTNQKNAEFRFTAKDYSPIHFQCQLNTLGGSTSQPDPEEALWTSCTSGISYDSSNLRQEGEYTFYLRAKDLSGNTSKKILEYSWTIDSTAPSLIYPCPQEDPSERNNPTPTSIRSANLDFPVSLYCKNEQEQFESCGLIDSSQTTVAVDSTYFIKKDLATNYYKKTLNIKAIDPSGNFSEPIECIWHVDTGHPTVDFVTPTPEYSYGTSTNPYVYPNPFKIEISDNSLQTAHTQSDAIEIEYKVYQCNQPLPTCNHQQAGSWRRLDISNPTTTKITSRNNPLELEFHITQGLNPGINVANKHKIEIRVKDAVGNPSKTLTTTWDVYGQAKQFNSIQSISRTSEEKADILFVLDDSGSMKDEARVLGQSFSGIISFLSNLNWQIAVTSMEQSPRGIKNFGKLVRLINNTNNTFLTNRYILSSQSSCSPPFYCSHNTSKLEDIFKRTITTGSGDNNFTFPGYQEYGIRSVNILLDYHQGITPNVRVNHYNNTNITELPNYRAPNRNEIRAIQSFFRENSTFVVILIADQKNCGDSIPGTRYYIPCHNTQSNQPDNPNYLIQEVEATLGEGKKFIFYPIIPKPGEGYGGLYPQRTDDDYWKLAKATQGRETESGTDPVIWVDVNHDTNTRTSRSNGSSCSINSNTNSLGIYTTDLCTISEDILRLTTHTIQLNCPPITTSLVDTVETHPPKYFYSSIPNIVDPNHRSFRPLTTSTGTNKIVSIGNVQVTINESWTNTSSTNTNRVTLEVQSGNVIPSGTYKVKYFCHLAQISTSI